MGDVEFIVAPGQPCAGRELADTLLSELALQAMPGSVSLGAFPAVDSRAVLPPVYVVIDPPGFASAGGRLPAPAILRRTIAIWTAGPPAAGEATLVHALRAAGAVFATSARSVEALRRAGVRARLLRTGYSESRDRFDPDAVRSCDVAFAGVDTPRRARRLREISDALGDCRLCVETAVAPPRADEPDGELAGGRLSLLARSEIEIVIGADEGNADAWEAVLDAIHCGAVVVCEPTDAITGLVPGTHLFVASAPALPHVVRALLRDRRRLRETRTRAHDWLRDRMPQALWASVLRAEVVELIGEPLTAPEWLPAAV